MGFGKIGLWMVQATLLVAAGSGAGVGKESVFFHDPELRTSFESIINSDKFRNQLLGIANKAGLGEMPRNNEDMFNMFSGMISDAKVKAAELERKEGTNKGDPSDKHGYDRMMHKSGKLLDKIADAAERKQSSSAEDIELVKHLGAGGGLTRDVLHGDKHRMGPGGQGGRALGVDAAAQGRDYLTMGSGDSAGGNLLDTFDKRGHISHGIKALAGVPKMPHVGFEEAMKIAIDNMPEEKADDSVKGMDSSKRLGSKVEALRRRGGDDQDEGGEAGSDGERQGEDNLDDNDVETGVAGDDAGRHREGDFSSSGEGGMQPSVDKGEGEGGALAGASFGVKKAMTSFELLKEAHQSNLKPEEKAFGKVPGLNLPTNDPRTMSPEDIQERALRAAVGRQHSEILKKQQKSGTPIGAKDALDTLRVRLASYQDEGHDEVLQRMGPRVEMWRNQGIDDLRAYREKGQQLKHEGHVRWKGAQMKHKLLKAQMLAKMRREL